MSDQVATLNPTSDPSLLAQQRTCPGCKQAVVTENGGVVVAFGQSFFHIDCFRCAKCNNQVTADTNLLLLSDGSPVCADCSYCCNVCGQPILDEAIMTGEDSYHAHCFNCRVCKKRIDELVFAKTSQGIYCMPCHNERVARSRKHHERREKEKREKERRAAAASQGPSSAGLPLNGDGNFSRTQDDQLRMGGNAVSPPPATNQSSEQYAAVGARSASENTQKRLTPRSSEFQPGSTIVPKGSSQRLPTSSAAAPSGTATPNGKRYSTLRMELPPSPITNQDSPEPPRAMTVPLSNMENLNIPATDSLAKTIQKAKSYDDRQLNVVAQQQNTDPTSKSADGLLAPDGATSRKEKRRSINPALTVTFNKLPLEPPRDNPFSSAPNTPYNVHIEQPETPSKNESVHAPSPLREQAPNSLVSSPPSYAREIDSGRSTHKSNLARMQLEASQDRPAFNRSRSASSTEQSTSNTFPASAPPLKSPMRMSFTLDRVPQRTTSRPENRSDFSAAYVSEAGRSTPQLVPEGRQSPSLSLASVNGRSSPMGRQRSFDNRNRTSTSSLGQMMELPPTPRSASRPTSPAHHVDVPHGIESGTDTETESEEIYVTESVTDSLPPLPPPKETKGLKAGTRPPQLKLDTVHVETDDRPDLSQIDSEDLSEDFSHEEGSLVESTSHSTYIAPALPPIRFSVVGSDFYDLLSTVGGSHDSVKALEAIAAATGGKAHGLNPDVKVATPEPATSAHPRTPTSDRTVAGTDATPIQRRDPNPKANATRHGMGTSPSERKSAENGRLSAEHSILRSVSSPEHRDGVPPKPPMPYQIRQRERGASNASLAPPSSGLAVPAEITLTPPAENGKVGHVHAEIADIVVRRLREALEDSRDRGATHVKMDTELVEAILSLLKQRQEESHDLKHRLDSIKRTSQQAMDGLTVAQSQYGKEIQARRDAEAEVARLRVLLSGQAVRLAAASGETMRQEAQKQLSRELNDNLANLERSLSQLRLQRDMALAEVEELSASKNTPNAIIDADNTARLSRALSMRFDIIKNQYEGELLPLTKEKEAIFREIAELKAMRDAVLGETVAISARNEALAQLNAQYAGIRTDVAGSDQSHDSDKRDGFFENSQPFGISTVSSTTAFSDESAEHRWVKPPKPDISETQINNTIRTPKFRWPGSKAQPQPAGMKELYNPPQEIKLKAHVEHNFQQISGLRVARCDHCGDKMWGSQLRCTLCNYAVHTRCGHLVHSPCSQQSTNEMPPVSLVSAGPSMFGRDLAEQVRAENKDEERIIPVIVEKCIDAVDTLALTYEGIYRKTGGSGQSKAITQLFERGDYASFDLKDTDRFNDICSVTSVLKNYFRSLPDPLLTYNLHEQFIAASSMKDGDGKIGAIAEVVSRLPPEHYNTTRALMLHLHRVSQLSDQNLMHARNLGVVFGPTLMRSRDPAAEFSDMAGKALTIECLVENAPSIFQPS